MPLTAARIGDRVVVTVPGRGDRRARPPHARAVRRRASRGERHRPGRARWLRQRVRVLLHDAGGVRRAALRGRHHRLRPGERAVPDAPRWRTWPAAWCTGGPAPAPHPFDPTRGLRPTRARPIRRAPRAAARSPSRAPTARLGHAVFRWRGGESGTDRPLDRAVRVACSAAPAGGWRTVDTRPRPDACSGASTTPSEVRRHPALSRRPNRRLQRRLGAAAVRLGRQLPVRGHGAPLPARLAALPAAPGARACAPRSRAAGAAPRCGSSTRRPCPSATSPPGRGSRGRAPSSCGWAASEPGCASATASAWFPAPPREPVVLGREGGRDRFGNHTAVTP